MRVLALLLLLAGATAAHAAGNLIANGDFEGRFGADGIAEGWADNSSWANLDVRYARDTANPHTGAACQRITCARLVNGAVQMVPASGVPLRKGAIYRVRVWLRGDAGKVAVQLRLAPAPYTIYVEKALDLRRQWQALEYLWQSGVDDAQARFMLRFAQTGSVWVDDLSLEELASEDAARLAPAPEPGNLLANGTFDLGTAGWLLNHGCDYWEEATLTIQPGEHGPCLRLDVPAGVSTTLSSDAVAVSPGNPVRLTCRVRAGGPGCVTMGTRYCGAQVRATAEWQTVSAAGKVRFDPSARDHFRLTVSGPARVWLDDVRLCQTDPPAGDARPYAAILSDRHPLALYHDGDGPLLRLLSLVPEGITPVPLAWRVEDFWGKTRLAGTWRPAAGRREKAILAKGLGHGWYRASVTWSQGEKAYRGECAFCILPPPERKGDARTSPFGGHFSVDPSGLRLAKAVGVRWLRLHPPNHTKWRTVEPVRGEWRWRDEPIRLARQAGLEICGSLDRIPRWASPAPEGTSDAYYTGWSAWTPKNWADWERYVAETVRHHRAEIHVWEVWNEPNLDDWLVPPAGQSRPEAYVEMLRHTTPVVKREDPTATVIAGVVAGPLRGNSSAERFAGELVERGALSLLDAFSFHDYISAPVDEGDDPLEVWVERFRARMRAAGKEVPILNSEGGFYNPGACLSSRAGEGDTITPERMARWLVRQYVSQMALGIRQFYFYNMFLDGSPVARLWDGFVEGDGQPRPNVATYAAMTWLLDGATFEHSERPSADVWVHRFRTPQGPLLIAWTRTGTQATLPVPAGARAYDLMGAPVPIPRSRLLPLTDAPVYVAGGQEPTRKVSRKAAK